jgi:hypothetical protein
MVAEGWSLPRCALWYLYVKHNKTFMILDPPLVASSRGVSTGTFTGRRRGVADRRRRIDKLGPRTPAEAEQRESGCDETPTLVHRDVRNRDVGAATVSMRVGRDPFGNWMRPFSFFAATSNAISSSLLGQAT